MIYTTSPNLASAVRPENILIQTTALTRGCTDDVRSTCTSERWVHVLSDVAKEVSGWLFVIRCQGGWISG